MAQAFSIRGRCRSGPLEGLMCFCTGLLGHPLNISKPTCSQLNTHLHFLVSRSPAQFLSEPSSFQSAGCHRVCVLPPSVFPQFIYGWVLMSWIARCLLCASPSPSASHLLGPLSPVWIIETALELSSQNSFTTSDESSVLPHGAS